MHRACSPVGFQAIGALRADLWRPLKSRRRVVQVQDRDTEHGAQLGSQRQVLGGHRVPAQTDGENTETDRDWVSRLILEVGIAMTID